MTDAQAKALAKLDDALKEATATGLFDVIAERYHPDDINTFCDYIEWFVKNELPKHS